uniref:Uncharacterized protein n=1 Tax=Glossina pallidipes TaxID=7398 RepID=A0A1A9ZTL7_GLOPL
MKASKAVYKLISLATLIFRQQWQTADNPLYRNAIQLVDIIKFITVFFQTLSNPLGDKAHQKIRDFNYLITKTECTLKYSLRFTKTINFKVQRKISSRSEGIPVLQKSCFLMHNGLIRLD